MNWLTKSDINFFKKEASNAGSEVLSDLVNDTQTNKKIKDLQEKVSGNSKDADSVVKNLLTKLSSKKS